MITNLIGNDKLFQIENTLSFNIYNGNIQLILSYSIFIFEFLNSGINLFNLTISNFYPQLLYASYSSLTIFDSVFDSSYEQLGDFEVSAIFLEYNMTFSIFNVNFSSLLNNQKGAVNYLFKLILF